MRKTEERLAAIEGDIEEINRVINALDLLVSRFITDRQDHIAIHQELETLVKEWKEVKTGARAHL